MSAMTPRGVLLVAGQFGLLGLLVVLPGGYVASGLRSLAMICVALSGATLAAAFLALRPSLTVMPEPKAGAPLITSGIYRWVRHPMYSAVILLGLSLVLVRMTAAAWATWLALVVVLVVKARYEDALLRERWPLAVDYQRTTGALVPRLSALRRP